MDTTVKVYNFEVADYHTYFVGKCGVAVHNNDCGWKKIGRWMSPEEYNLMKITGKVQEGSGGQTFFSTAGSGDYKQQTLSGNIYVEFEVPANSLLQGGKPQWFKAISENANKSQIFLLKKQNGEFLPSFRNLSAPIDTK